MSTSTGDAAPKSSPPPNEKGLKLDMADEWSAAAEAYSGNFQEHPDRNRPHIGMYHGRKLIVTRVTTFLAEKESPVVLDIAAAGGEPALSMAKEMPHATVYGTDFAPGMVEMMRKRCEEAGVSNIKTRVEDGQALSGFDDGSVDVVTCSWGLESMPDHLKAIEQFHRVLKPGGMAIFAAWDKDPNSIAVKMFGAISALGNEMSPDIQPLGGDNGLKAMENAGFIEVKKTPAAIPFYVPPSFGFRDILPFMIKSTPINGVLAAMEKSGRTDVREEACALFESQVLEDIAQGRAPTGPGLGRANEADPPFYMNAVIFEGYKKGGM